MARDTLLGVTLPRPQKWALKGRSRSILLAFAVTDEPIPSSVLLAQVGGKPKTLTNALDRLNKKLALHGWRVVNTTPRGRGDARGKRAHYALERLP